MRLIRPLSIPFFLVRATLGVLLLVFCRVPQAHGESSLSIEWFEPKVKATSRDDVFHVIVDGKTLSDTSVLIDSRNITLIQRSDSHSHYTPRVGEKEYLSDAKGKFHIDLYMPLGLSQVSIRFVSLTGIKRTELLVMRVDSQNVTLNVKVTRPTKVVKVMIEAKRKYFLSLGLAPESFQESFAVPSSAGLNLQSTSFASLQFEAAALSEKWWWLVGYRYSGFTDYTIQAMDLGARYKLNRSAHQVWLGIEVDGDSFPFIASNALAQSSLFKASLYGSGGSLTYRHESEAMIAIATFVYRIPFSLRIESGQLAFDSKYDLILRTGLDYKFAPWFIGAGLEAYLSSFNYQYANSPLQISNNGSGTLSNFVFLIKAGRRFGSSPNPMPNP
jgi:hypothetical protein